jgi:hypothetical protein
MANIVLIKFVSGEEVIADLISSGESAKVISDAVTLVYRQTENGKMTVGFAPFMPYAEGTITLYDNSILAISQPQEDLKNEFNRIFGSGIVVAQANDAAFKA